MGSRSLGFCEEETITKCFKITGTTFSVVSRKYEDEDPFDVAESQEELHNLIEEVSLLETKYPVEEYIKREDDVPIMYMYIITITVKIAYLLSWVLHKQTWTKRILNEEPNSS